MCQQGLEPRSKLGTYMPSLEWYNYTLSIIYKKLFSNNFVTSFMPIANQFSDDIILKFNTLKWFLFKNKRRYITKCH